MDNVISFNGVERPLEVSLMDAIEDAIDNVAAGKMTHIEVVGVLEGLSTTSVSSSVLCRWSSRFG